MSALRESDPAANRPPSPRNETIGRSAGSPAAGAMKQSTYWLLEGSSNRGYKHVPTGFSVGAALFGPFWAAWKGSLALLLAFSAGSAILYFLPQWVASPYSPGLSRTLPTLASAGYVAVLGLYSNTWFRSALESDGWKLVGMTHMKRPQPPEQVGEWVVREYALITWPVNDPPQKPTARSPNAAGYLVGQHERDTTRWTLIPADRSWSALEEVLFDSQQEARALAEEHHPVLQGQWRVMAG